jgi:hypothetical protein
MEEEEDHINEDTMRYTGSMYVGKENSLGFGVKPEGKTPL